MRIDIVTIFPAMVENALRTGVVGRAIERGTLDVRTRDLREFTTDRHRVVDDVPYGGGPGMVLKPEPLFRAIDAVEQEGQSRPYVVLTSPQGTRLTSNRWRRTRSVVGCFIFRSTRGRRRSARTVVTDAT